MAEPAPKPKCGCKILMRFCKKCGRKDPTFEPKKTHCKSKEKCSGIFTPYKTEREERCEHCEDESSSSDEEEVADSSGKSGQADRGTSGDDPPREQGRGEKGKKDTSGRKDRSKSPRKEDDDWKRKRTPFASAIPTRDSTPVSTRPTTPERQMSGDQKGRRSGSKLKREDSMAIGPVHKTGTMVSDKTDPYEKTKFDILPGALSLGGSGPIPNPAGTMGSKEDPWGPPMQGASMVGLDPMDSPDPFPAGGGQGGLPSINSSKNANPTRSGNSGLWLKKKDLPLPKENEIPQALPYKNLAPLGNAAKIPHIFAKELAKISANLVEPPEWEVWRAHPSYKSTQDLRYRHARPQRWMWPFPLPYEPWVYYRARQRQLGSARTDEQTMLRRYWWREDQDDTLRYPDDARERAEA